MIFDYPGYDLQFIQKRRIKDGSAHLFSFLYKFYSPITELQYVLTADYHEGDFFAIKFYAKMLRKSDFKYSLITNKGDVGNLLVTCLKCVPLLLKRTQPRHSDLSAPARMIRFLKNWRITQIPNALESTESL